MGEAWFFIIDRPDSFRFFGLTPFGQAFAVSVDLKGEGAVVMHLRDWPDSLARLDAAVGLAIGRLGEN